MKRGLGGVLVREEGMGGRIFFLTKGCKELSGGSHNWVIFGRCRVSAQLFFCHVEESTEGHAATHTGGSDGGSAGKGAGGCSMVGVKPSRRRNSVAFFSI
jgi:hypothetical protein